MKADISNDRRRAIRQKHLTILVFLTLIAIIFGLLMVWARRRGGDKLKPSPNTPEAKFQSVLDRISAHFDGNCKQGDHCSDASGAKRLLLMNELVAPKLQKLLQTAYFRYFKINLERPCPFWNENLMCTSRGCAVEIMEHHPNGWESVPIGQVSFPFYQLDRGIFNLWEYDDEEDFCAISHDYEEGVFVDLIENPERFTGYAGPPAHRIWQTIYEENCFVRTTPGHQEEKNDNDDKDTIPFPPNRSVWSKCEERHIFYSIISGLHTSISIHLADRFFDQERNKWGPNPAIYEERVGRHSDRIRNLFLVHSLLHRAVSRLAGPEGVEKIVAALEKAEDSHGLGKMISDLFRLPHAPGHGSSRLEGSVLFAPDTSTAAINEFREHFRNVSRIMNCVSCERCRLWGKIQTLGLGTALKVHYTIRSPEQWSAVKFRKSEIIALFNTYGRFSESLHALLQFEESRAGEDSRESVFSFLEAIIRSDRYFGRIWIVAVALIILTNTIARFHKV